jgi:4-amino-4-deoxy-L-arabinose transferase-like glycosyltransferase
MVERPGENIMNEPADCSGGWGRDLVWLALALGLLFGAVLGARALWGPDEGRYVEIAREMAASGDCVTPRLNGVKYFEKPPLFYWLEAGAIHLFGLREWAMRLVPALFALLGCLAVYAAGRRLFGRRAGLLAAAVLATSPLYYFLANAVTLDMAVSALLTIALLAFLVARAEPEGRLRRNLLWSFYLALALATLTKGLIGIIIPGMILVVWMVLVGEWGLPRRMRLVSGTALFLVVAAPWHALVARANPEFLWFYFIHEHVLRYLTKIHDRYEPPWYFVPILLGGLIPWTVFLWPALRAALPVSWRDRRDRRKWKVELFLILWAGLIFGFFSLSDSKLIPYILPVAPPLALLLGRHLAGVWEGRGDRELRIACAVLLVFAGGLGLAFALAPYLVGGQPKMAHYLAILGGGAYLMAGSLLFLGIVPLVFALRRRRVQALAAIFAGAILFVSTLMACGSVFNTERSTRSLALWLKPRLRAEDRVVTYRTYIQELPVYLERRITVAGWLGELEMGTQVEDTSGWMIDLGAFDRLWRAPGTVYLLTQEDRFRKLAGTGLPLYALARSGKIVLAVNHPPGREE